MAEALMKMYETMTETEQNELYDFALFIISKRKKRILWKNFAGF